ncbi:MAG: hypothetical protein ACSHWZ_03565 [Sulfitobacter sp.]
MSVQTHDNFVQRLTTLGRKHSKMTNGYTTKVGRDGLITVKPKRAKRGFPLRGLLLSVAGFFVFKAFMLAASGPATYEERLATLQNGSQVEALGAAVLAVDPVTQAIAEKMGPLLR